MYFRAFSSSITLSIASVLYSSQLIFFSALDDRLGSLIGFEQDEKRLYGYDNNKETVLVSPDYGITWLTADVNKLATDKLQSWTDAKEVPLDTSLDLDQLTPSGPYTFNAFGGENSQRISGNQFLSTNADQNFY